MKRIKHKIILGVVAVSAITWACSKSFTDITPSGALSQSVIATKAGVEGLLVGAYSLLDGVGGAGGDNGPWASAGSNWVYGSCAGGDAHKGSDPGDQNLITPIESWTVNASNNYLSDVWSARYDGVQRANEAIRIMRLAKDMSGADTVQVLAEARFLRGHYHFELKKLFGHVPWIDETITYSAGNFLVPNDKDVLPMIEEDFAFAYSNLPEKQADLGRANKWAAACYLMKTYIYEKKYTDALALWAVIKASGKTSSGAPYALNAKFSDTFNPAFRNSAESVFAAQSTVNDGASGGNANQGDGLNFPYGGQTGCCGFYQPSFSLANSYKVVPATGLPMVDGSYNASDLKSDQGINSNASYSPDNSTPLDPRIDWTIGRRGIPYLDWGLMAGASWVRNQASAGPYEPVKHLFYKSQLNTLTDASGWTAGFTANNINLIRYADVILLAAEAEIEAGSLANATALVNQVRNRVSDPTTWVQGSVAKYQIGLYPSTFASQAAARTALYFERKLELAMEGQRFFDISRWGIAKAELDPYYAHETGSGYLLVQGATFTNGKNEYLPIPQTQIDKSFKAGKSVLAQNPGY